MPIGLLALALGGFGIGLTEFGIMGLLPQVAADFGVSEPVAGYLISGYALSVAVGGIALTAAITRFDRKKVLLALMVLFIAGNLISALAPTYSVLMVGRIVAALCHGAFFGVGSVVAADMVAPNKRAGAIALMFTGLTVANVLGVPLGTLLGQQLGWRSTFWAITIIGIVALAGIRLLVPPTPAPTETSLRTELGAFRRPQVWISAAVTVLGFGGMFGGFTYIAFTLTEVSGFATTSVPWLLVLFGAGMFVGNFVGGKLADWALNTSLMVILALLTVVLVVFALTAQSKVMTIVSLLLMGAVGFASVAGLQLRIMGYAQDAPTMASGANIAAFNIGNALGAWLSGLAIGAGFGFVSPLWVGAGVTVAGLVVLVAGSVRPSRPVPDAAAAVTG
ncbi:MAG: transporter, family, inner rane transport protein [Pseudonocardiales bacterium]|jgi:DHA1 family inner membrane transport protein|nr:transporter, family, inner rane transport protein [Pseudonocardiales bacterium]MDT7683389.1 transporter, family, inner rane transport protein [Pseudonocardiales bacterium]